VLGQPPYHPTHLSGEISYNLILLSNGALGLSKKD